MPPMCESIYFVKKVKRYHVKKIKKKCGEKKKFSPTVLIQLSTYLAELNLVQFIGYVIIFSVKLYLFFFFFLCILFQDFRDSLTLEKDFLV